MKRITELYGGILMVLLLFMAAQPAQAQISVSLPGIVAEPGEEIVFPVNVENLTGAGVLAYSIDINFNPEVLQIDGISKSGTISANAFTSFSVGDGVFYIRAASGSELTGSGSLIDVRATVLAAGASPLSFADAEFENNDGVVPSETEDGFVTTSNEAPTAQNVAAETDEETPVEVTLRGSDAEGVDLAFTIVTQPEHGSLGNITPADGETATVTYTPNEDFSGQDVFTYQVSDGELAATATATITVAPVQDAPEAVDDQYDVDEDTELSVDAASGVLQNDVDPDGDPLTATLVTDVVNGDLVFNADGSFTYTPQAEFSGTDSFTYVASDGIEESQPATVTIVVAAVNDMPTFTQVLPDTSIAELDELSFTYSAEDIDSETLSFELVDAPAGAGIDAETGEFSFSPQVGQAGEHVIVVNVTDGDLTASTSATVVVEGLEITHSTELSGWNVLEPNASRADGSIAAILEGSSLIVTGSFDGLSSALADVDVRVGATDETGPSVLPLSAAVTTRGQGGSILAENNTFELVDSLVQALDENRLYVSIRTAEFPNGEIRGQIRSADNEAPSASDIISPVDGASVTIGGSLQDPADGGDALIDVSWESADDPDGDRVAYVYEVAADADFDAVLSTNRFPTNDGFTLTVADAAEIFDAVTGGTPGSIAVGSTVTLYHRVVTTDGSEATVGSESTVSLTRGQIVSTGDSELPEDFNLNGNYPNPFNPTTTINFDLPSAAHVSIQVIDALGREVLSVPARGVDAGEGRTLELDGSALTSGTYLYRVVASVGGEQIVRTGTMTLLK